MIIALDAGSPDAAAAEHLLHDLLPTTPGSPVVASTHLVRTPDAHPHVALAIADPAGPEQLLTRLGGSVGYAVLRSGAAEPEVAGPSKLLPGAYVAAVETALGTAGRLVRFPGQELVRGVLRAGELRERCGIDRIEAIGGVAVDDDSLVDTLGFIRPFRRDGTIVLQLQPAAGGLLIPFELQHQQACCADH